MKITIENDDISLEDLNSGKGNIIINKRSLFIKKIK